MLWCFGGGAIFPGFLFFKDKLTRTVQVMPLELAMVGRKRERKEPSGEGASGGCAGLSKRGRGAAGGKPVYECTLCGKACSQSSHLTEHMRTHSCDRPYPCTTCGQAFSTSGNLTTHMRTHIRDQTLRLHDLRKAFTRSSHMTEHSLLCITCKSTRPLRVSQLSSSSWTFCTTCEARHTLRNVNLIPPRHLI